MKRRNHLIILVIAIMIGLSVNCQSLLFDAGLTSYGLQPTAKIGYTQNINENDLNLFHWNVETGIRVMPPQSQSHSISIAVNAGTGLQYCFDYYGVYRLKLLVTGNYSVSKVTCIEKETTIIEHSITPGFILAFEANQGYVSIETTRNMISCNVGFRFINNK